MASAAQRQLEVETSSPALTESLSPAPDIAAHENPPALTSALLSAEDIYRLIQEAAYFKAEARNFAPGVELQDWLEAENEVKKRLKLS